MKKQLKRLKQLWSRFGATVWIKYPRVMGFLLSPNAPEFLSVLCFGTTTMVH